MCKFITACIITAVLTSMSVTLVSAHGTDTDEELQSVILEVEGDPSAHIKELKARYPFVDIVKTFDVLFNGIAIKGPPEKIAQVGERDFVKVIHPVTTYSVPEPNVSSHIDFEAFKTFKRSPADTVLSKHNKTAIRDDPPVAPDIIPNTLNTTCFTGKGVKVGVIDTGIDMDHPDLQANYKGGYDLVDLDDEPKETDPSEGAPTLHGSHVAGIIAANGQLKGVAPDAELYAYRALGPGGSGTSVQVIAALEQAVRDGMDIINLSLGNTVNGPDFPTSQAVNKAVQEGKLVVTANGNDGPKDWTVGSPATSAEALSVGATSPAAKMPYLFHAATDTRVQMTSMIGASPWTLKKDYPLKVMDEEDLDMTGHIALVKRNDTTFYELASQAEEQGAVSVLIMNNEKGLFTGSVANEPAISIPVAAISQEEGQRLRELTNSKEQVFLDTSYEKTAKAIAPFSSRGPVTVSWDIKPQIVAPGVNVVSTVPDGYQELQGTSMAAPHVAGALAVLKEAQPQWSNKRLKSALTTTAQPIKQANGSRVSPSIQGAGVIDINAAITSDTLIEDPFITYGRVDSYKKTKTTTLKIENVTDKAQTYTFSIPKKTPGLAWELPQTFTVDAHQTKTVPIGLSITSMQLDQGIHQGWLDLKRSGDLSYQLPYLFINKTSDYPKAMGVEIAPKPFSKTDYTYSFYLPDDDIVKVTIDLYDPASLIHEQRLLETKEVNGGLNEGNISRSNINKPGRYKGLVSMTFSDGTIKMAETDLIILP